MHVAKDHTIARAWADFRANVIPREAPPIQVSEMRKAFYAGAFDMLAFMRNVIGGDDVSEDEGIAICERLFKEGEAFGRKVGAR